MPRRPSSWRAFMSQYMPMATCTGEPSTRLLGQCGRSGVLSLSRQRSRRYGRSVCNWGTLARKLRSASGSVAVIGLRRLNYANAALQSFTEVDRRAALSRTAAGETDAVRSARDAPRSSCGTDVNTGAPARSATVIIAPSSGHPPAGSRHRRAESAARCRRCNGSRSTRRSG